MIKKLFCDHDFNLTHQFEIPSEFDIIIRAGKIPNTHHSIKRKYITDYKCIKCNKIKRLIAITPRG